MPATRNLCAQLPLDLHQRVCEAREESGLTTAQYITNLLLEYYEMKENGGNAAMTNGKNRTLAFQCQRQCNFVVFRRTENVEKWRVKVYSHCIIILAVFVRQA